MERYGPEISDVIVDYDPVTLVRREVTKREAVDLLRDTNMPGRARRIAGAFATRGEAFDPDAVDGVLVRSHLELQRLHEEFRVAALMRQMLVPVIELIAPTHKGPIRVVDLGVDGSVIPSRSGG